MKVLLFNGSPRKEGCTFTALTEIANTLKEEGIESEIYQLENHSELSSGVFRQGVAFSHHSG